MIDLVAGFSTLSSGQRGRGAMDIANRGKTIEIEVEITREEVLL
jgi:hypothetical protein